jgi:hypothetical protein
VFGEDADNDDNRGSRSTKRPARVPSPVLQIENEVSATAPRVATHGGSDGSQMAIGGQEKRIVRRGSICQDRMPLEGGHGKNVDNSPTTEMSLYFGDVCELFDTLDGIRSKPLKDNISAVRTWLERHKSKIPRNGPEAHGLLILSFSRAESRWGVRPAGEVSRRHPQGRLGAGSSVPTSSRCVSTSKTLGQAWYVSSEDSCSD